MRFFGIVILVFGLFLSCKSEEKEKTAYLSSEELVMAAPIVRCESLFFTDSVEVKMDFSLPNTTIKYTLDGSEVSAQSKKYESPFRLKKTTRIRAKNFHPQYQSSAESVLQVVQTNTKLFGSIVTVNPAPNARYQGAGTSSLIDFKKGTMTFANGNAWLGFQAANVSIHIDFPREQDISKITVSSMANYGGWIFLPESITVFSGKKQLGHLAIQKPLENDSSRIEFIEIPIEKQEYKNIEIKVNSLSEIPVWHPGKGTLPWFFVDEILVE